jgi:hypothetical protein
MVISLAGCSLDWNPNSNPSIEQADLKIEISDSNWALGESKQQGRTRRSSNTALGAYLAAPSFSNGGGAERGGARRAGARRGRQTWRR